MSNVSTPGLIARVPLFGMAVILAGLTLIALLFFIASSYHYLGYWRLTFFVPSVALAVYYLNEYRKLPYEPWHFFPESAAGGASTAPPTSTPPVTATPTPPEEEPFEDPVEEADRLERAGPSEPADRPPSSSGP